MTAEPTTSPTPTPRPFGADPLYLPALGEPRATDAETRTLQVTITTRARDREGDVVEPRGLDFDAFLQNPVVLWAHDLTRAPIGRVRAVEVRDDRVDATVQFADTAMGREIHGLYAERYLNAWSIGFLPREWSVLEDTDGAGSQGFHITAAEVVELSAVPVPANPEALTHALREGALALSPRVRKALGMPAPGGDDPTPTVLPDAAPTVPTRPATRRGIRLPLTRAVRLAEAAALACMRRELDRAVAAARGRLA